MLIRSFVFWPIFSSEVFEINETADHSSANYYSIIRECATATNGGSSEGLKHLVGRKFFENCLKRVRVGTVDRQYVVISCSILRHVF